MTSWKVTWIGSHVEGGVTWGKGGRVSCVVEPQKKDLM